MMAILPNKMLWPTILLAGLMVLVTVDGSVMKMNNTSTVTPNVRKQMSTTTTTTTTTTPPPIRPPPPFAAVMDLFQAPLAAFKPKVPVGHQEEENNMPMGRAQNNTATTPATAPISNLLLNAGQGIGSAASSFSGWFNNRIIPQALRAPTSTTTKAPPVIIRIPSQQIKRKALQNKRRPQSYHRRPVLEDIDDMEDDVDDDDLGEIENYNFEDDEDDADYEYIPLKPQKGFRHTKKQPNVEYFYIQEEHGDIDDFDYDDQLPVKKPRRKPQNYNNRRRKNPVIIKRKPQQQNGGNQIRRKPVNRIQNAQMVQFLPNRPSQTQVKRQRRPAATFELIPITANQALNSIQKKKPSSATQNNQKRPNRFINIPWSRLGFAGPPKETTSNEQQSKPIIVQIPQQSLNRKGRPTKKPTKVGVKTQRKPLRAGQIQNQSPVFSILSEDEIRDILKSQEVEPSKKPQMSNLPVTLSEKKKPTMESNDEADENSPNNDDVQPEEKPQAESEVENVNEDDANAFIVVGADDDKEIDVDLSRQTSRRGFKRGRFSQRLRQQMEIDDDDDDDE